MNRIQSWLQTVGGSINTHKHTHMQIREVNSGQYEACTVTEFTQNLLCNSREMMFYFSYSLLGSCWSRRARTDFALLLAFKQQLTDPAYYAFKLLFPIVVICKHGLSQRRFIPCLCHLILILQPYGPGKYVFDSGCEQHGEFHHAEQVTQH